MEILNYYSQYRSLSPQYYKEKQTFYHMSSYKRYDIEFALDGLIYNSQSDIVVGDLEHEEWLNQLYDKEYNQLITLINNL